MPSDLKLGIDDYPMMVIDQFDIGFPFSRGILASSILATGIETPKAYIIAQKIQDRLRKSNIQNISGKELTEMTVSVLKHEISSEISQCYKHWQDIRNSGRPIIIALSAASGIGKSTIATRLALRLGINRVITTDSLREVLRTVIPNTVLPELHVSTFESLPRILSESHISTFQRQSHAVEAACVAVSKRYIMEKKNIIIEGVHLLPGELSKQLGALKDRPIVVELFLSLSNEEQHRSQLIHRSTNESSRKGDRNINNFDAIRSIQTYLKDMALQNNIQEYDLEDNEDLTKKVITLIINKSNES